MAPNLTYQWYLSLISFKAKLGDNNDQRSNIHIGQDLQASKRMFSTCNTFVSRSIPNMPNIHSQPPIKMSAAATNGPSWLSWAELPARTDVYSEKGTTAWGNHDLYPIPQKERKMGVKAYFAYWITTGVSVGTFTLGSAYIAVGLTAGETLGAILAGCVISCIVGCLCGKPGMDYNLGYVSCSSVAESKSMWGECSLTNLKDFDESSYFWTLGYLAADNCCWSWRDNICKLTQAF